MVAGLAITLADPGGPIEAAKETMATMHSATSPPSREQLLSEVALDVQEMVQHKQNPLKGYRPTGDQPTGDLVLAELREVHDIVAAKASPEESAAFGEWLVGAARAAAEAAREGGFLGFHAVRVSEREQAMIDRVRETVAA
nr:hypothetical protein [Nocardioides panaciterrulae]